MTLGERVIVMNKGKIQQEGTPSEIYDRPQTRFVAEFIGRSNWFSGTAGKLAGGFTELMAGGDKPLLIHVPSEATGAAYDVCVRPEYMHVRSSNDPDIKAPGPVNELRGVVKDIMYLGASLEMIVTLDNGNEISAIEPKQQKNKYERGAPVIVTFRPSDAIVIGRP